MREFELTPVPPQQRRSLLSIMVIWFASPLIASASLVGAMLVMTMGFVNLCYALVISSLMQLTYAGILGVIGAKTGKNFALLAKETFGPFGYRLVTALVALTLLCWVAVEVAIMAQNMHQSLHLSYSFLVILVILFVYGVTFFGIRGLHLISLCSAPLYLVAAVVILIIIAPQLNLIQVINFHPKVPQLHSVAIGTAMMFSMWVDGTTASADYCRWAKNAKASWLSVFIAFPWASCFSFLVGAVVAVVSLPHGGDVFVHGNMFSFLIEQHHLFMTIFAIVFLFVNLGSVSAHSLYYSTTQFANLFQQSFRAIVLPLIVIALVLALSGVWRHISQWLQVRGIGLPPIGVAVMMHYYFYYYRQLQKKIAYHIVFIAVLLGVITAAIIDVVDPQWVSSVWGMLCTILILAMAQKVNSKVA